MSVAPPPFAFLCLAMHVWKRVTFHYSAEQDRGIGIHWRGRAWGFMLMNKWKKMLRRYTSVTSDIGYLPGKLEAKFWNRIIEIGIWRPCAYNLESKNWKLDFLMYKLSFVFTGCNKFNPGVIRSESRSEKVRSLEGENKMLKVGVSVKFR